MKEPNLYDLRFIEELENSLYKTKDIEEYLKHHNDNLLGFNENIKRFKEMYI